MRALLLILTICLTFQFSYSQESSTAKYIIKGKVMASLISTPTPVTESAIQLTGKKTDITETNESGEFIFRNLENGAYKLKIISELGTIDTVLLIDNKSISDFSVLFFSSCDVNKKVALQDLENGKPRLLIIGGVVPVFYVHQNIFEDKYCIKYEDFGCSAPPKECVLEYNQVIFDYLTDKFGNEWRKEVRKDVVGMK
jgi:hypothetical protein